MTRHFDQSPEGREVMRALYAPDFPGLYGETCRPCTGRGHREFTTAGRTYLITCESCDGCGTVTSVSIGRAA